MMTLSMSYSDVCEHYIQFVLLWLNRIIRFRSHRKSLVHMSCQLMSFALCTLLNNKCTIHKWSTKLLNITVKLI